MKRIVAVLIALALIAGLLAASFLNGCQGSGNGADSQDPPAQTDPSETPAGPDGGTEPSSTPAPTPSPSPEPLIENISNNEDGHHTFQPHVFSARYLEEFGEKQRDAFFAFCDAVRAGEDSFPCPDEETYGWCVGRLATYFSPVAYLYVSRYSPDGTPAYQNGRGRIFYTIPKEEFVQRQKQFEEEIVRILDDCVSDDYTDFEKMLSLYEYITLNYTYDYDMYEHSMERSEEQSAYRCLVEKKGICVEIASLYNYLLLQLGVDSEEMGGSQYVAGAPSEGHAWVFVNLDGKSYHIDPTFGLSTDLSDLSYFMMTDEIREIRDDLPAKEFTLGAKGDQSRDFFQFEATDEKYKELWIARYVGMDREAQDVVYLDLEGDQRRFHYGE